VIAMRALLFLLCLGSAALAGAREDWEKIEALDAGPGVQPNTAEEAKQISLGHTQKQEKALRAFLAAYAGNEHAFEARLRLARLVALRAELRGEPLPEESGALIREAEKAASTPAQRAEVDFAKIAQRMRQSRGKRPGPDERRNLLDAARVFQRDHPDDRRVAALLIEVATLFDGDIKTKQTLLSEAKKLTSDPDLLAQIADDTKRIGWIGKVLPLKFTATDGTRVDVKDWAGKPVIIVYFATWSPPSCTVFSDMRRLADKTDAGFVGISLDTDGMSLAKFLAKEKTKSAIAYDGKAWDGPLVQALGINAVPAVWMLDAKGMVRTLDPLDAPEELLKQLQR
jgi:peroxiredoxin